QEGAIQGVDVESERPGKVSFDGTTQLDVTDDTVILFVDTKNFKGVAGGTVTAADKVEGAYVKNAYYGTSGTDLTFLVVDTHNRLEGATVTIRDANTSKEVIQDLLDKGNLEIGAALTTPMTLNVPENTTLTITESPNAQLTIEAAAGST